MIDNSLFAANTYALLGVILAEIITFVFLKVWPDLCQTVPSRFPLKSMFLTLVNAHRLAVQICEDGAESVFRDTSLAESTAGISSLFQLFEGCSPAVKYIQTVDH